MPAEYAVGHGKPPVSGQFRKGQSGNPGGRPGIKKIRRRKFAQMLDAAMCESTELVAMTPCASNYAASAKGMALDCVRGKTAMLRLMLSLLDELDHVSTDGRQRRGFDRRLEEMEAADAAAAAFENEQETDVSVRPVSQGVIEEERLRTWDEYAGEAPGFVSSSSPPNVSRPATAGRPDETDPEGDSEKKSLLDGEPQSGSNWVARSKAGHDSGGGGGVGSSTAASRPSEGTGQGRRVESERSFLAVARRVPSEKEFREQEKQAEIERSRKAYEEAVAHVKAFAAKRGYAFRESQCSNSPENAPSPLSEGNSQGIINSHPEEGPNKRALRQRFERIAAADRMEAERKAALAAKAEGSLILRQAQDEGIDKSPRPEPGPPVQPGEGRGVQTNMREPEPLPDYAIWMRGQRAPP